MAANDHIFFNGVKNLDIHYNGGLLGDIHFNGVHSYTSILHLTLTQHTSLINLRSFINARNPNNRTRVIVTNTLTQPRLTTGNLSGLTVELINNGEFQGEAAGRNGMEITSALKLTNNGWIRGAGGNGGKGGTAGRGATGAKGANSTKSVTIQKAQTETRAYNWPTNGYRSGRANTATNMCDIMRWDGKQGVHCAGRVSSIPGLSGVFTLAMPYVSDITVGGQYAGAYGNFRIKRTWTGPFTTTTPITGGAGGRGGAGGAGGNGGVGQWFRHNKTNGAGGHGGAAGAAGRGSSPAGGNAGRRGATGYTGGKGGNGGTWATAGSRGATGSHGSAGAGGSGAGKAITGWARVVTGSKRGNVSGAVA